MTASLQIIETPWTIDGDPDAVWIWGEGEGADTPFQPADGNPTLVSICFRTKDARCS